MFKKFEKLFESKYLVYSFIAALALIVYSNSLLAPFTLDDFSSITDNYSIRNPFDIVSIWKFYSNRFILYYSLSLNYAVHNSYVFGYHITNIILHALNGILVYFILYHILGLAYFSNKFPAKFPRLLSLLSALLFISHPVQINAVTYIIQRTAALAATFYFLAILFYLKFRIDDKARYFILTILFTILAMFTKENTITIPFMLILLEMMFFLKDGKTTWVKRASLIFILLLTVPIIPGTTLLLQGYSQSDPNISFKASTEMDRLHYFYTELNVIVRYIKILLVPVGLNFDYSNDFPVSKTIWENHSYISFGILSCIGLLGIAFFKRNKLLSLGVFWFFIGLAVESSFISIKDVYFEHRLYFPLVGFILVILGVFFAGDKGYDQKCLFKKPVTYITAICLVLLPAYSMLTLYRNYIFSDGIRLWSDVVSKAPNSDRAHSVLATNYLESYEKNENWDHLKRAEEEFIKAIQMNYRNDTAHCNLAKVYYLQGEYEKCVHEAKTTLSMVDSVYAYHNLGLAYKGLGKNDDAIEAFLSAYRIDHKCTFILKSLGNTYYEMNDLTSAKFYYEEFMKYNPYSDSKEIVKRLESIKAAAKE